MATPPSRRFRALDALSILVGMLLFSAAALWNGYPLLFHDSATYIADGFTGQFIAVRAVFYPLFLRMTTLSGLSIWYVIFAQNLMLSFAVWSVFRQLRRDAGPRTLLMVYVFSSLICGAAWVQGQVMADAFAPIAILSFVLLLLPCKRHWLHELAIGVLFVSSALAHVSHLLLLTAALVVSFLLARASGSKMALCFKRTALMILGAWVLSAFLNFSTDGKWRPVESFHPHLIGRLAESGILGRLLSEHCQEKKYLFCGKYPSGPIFANDVIWKEDGLLSKSLGHADTEAYWEMILDSILKYPGSFLLSELKSSGSQLIHFALGDRLYSYANAPWMEESIRLTFPEDLATFRKAHQQTGGLDFTLQNRLLILSLLASMAVFFRRSFRMSLKKYPELAWALTTFLVCIVLNAVICAGISRVTDRYQARVIWLWPAVVFIVGWRQDLLKPEC